MRYIATMSRLSAVLISSMLLANSAAAKEIPKHWPAPINDHGVITKLKLDRLEVRDGHYGVLRYWEGEAWSGGDMNKLWLKSEGSVRRGRVDEADLQAFYSRAVAPFWDLQLGARHDFGTHGGPSRDWAAFGMKGLAPYRFDMDITGYLGQASRAGARFKVKYDLLLTQRLILTPELEFNAYTKYDPSFGSGAGLADMDAGIRLRYEIRREIAPYIGVAWTNKFGGTANLASTLGDVVHDTYAVMGIRVWR
jgi:copper resistance protein B